MKDSLVCSFLFSLFHQKKILGKLDVHKQNSENRSLSHILYKIHHQMD